MSIVTASKGIFAAVASVALSLGTLSTPALANCGQCEGDHPAATTHKHDIVDTALEAGSFKTLCKAVEAAGLVDALRGRGPFTVFAPTDEAFAKLPKEQIADLLKPENKEALRTVLLYHVAPGQLKAARVADSTHADTLSGQRVDITRKGGAVYVDDAKVVQTDILASNGVIHVIDRPILPKLSNLVEVAQGAGQFQTLIAAAKAAGLVEALSGDGPLTVFAPTDDAFAKLPAGTVESLLQPENRDRLAAILKYHVVPGWTYADGVVKAGSLETLNGKSLTARHEDGHVTVQDAKVVQANIEARNGVIHVIDTVMLPG